MQSERHPSSEDYANVLGRGHTLRDTLSFLSFCNIHDSLRIQTIAWEGKPITKVAKLDFQVVAFGHLFSIACLNATQRRHRVSPVDLFNTCKATSLHTSFSILCLPRSSSLSFSLYFHFVSVSLFNS